MHFLRRNEQARNEQDIATIHKYGELLLTNPDGSPRVAIHDVISTRQTDGLITTSRLSFYREDNEWRLDVSHENSDSPETRQYVRPVQTDVISMGQPAYEAGTLLMKWRRFSPLPTSDVRPFLKLLEQGFGKLPR